MSALILLVQTRSQYQLKRGLEKKYLQFKVSGKQILKDTLPMNTLGWKKTAGGGILMALKKS